MTSIPQGIRPGRPADWPALLALLRDAGLPTQDLSGLADLRTWILDTTGSIQGVIALEPYDSEGLLRSLAVAPNHRRRGIARALVTRLELEARASGIRQLILLTETAQAFFQQLGYRSIDRNQVSEAVRNSAEFQTLCPASAICMMKSLPPGDSR